MYAASQGASVYAFEPCADSFEILQWNVSKNGLEGRVKTFNAAVTNKQGNVDLFVGLDTSGEAVLVTASTHKENTGAARVQTRSVESVTLDSLLANSHIEKCDFLKIDCEGAEYEILASTSQESFSKIARIAMECHEDRMQEAVTILKNAGFEIVYERWGFLGFLKATNTRLTT